MSEPRSTRAEDPPAGGQSDDESFVHRPDGISHPSPLRARAFLGLLQAADSLARALDADLQAAHGMSLRTYEVLLHLAAFAPEGSLRVSQLAKQALVSHSALSQSRMSRLVAELEGQGLVQRSAYAEDSRGVSVTITEAGLGRLRAAHPTHHAGLEARLFSRLSGREIVQLARITAKVLADDDS